MRADLARCEVGNGCSTLLEGRCSTVSVGVVLQKTMISPNSLRYFAFGMGQRRSVPSSPPEYTASPLAEKQIARTGRS